MLIRAYRAAVRLLPPDMRADGVDMARTFEALVGEVSGARARLRLSVRAFGKLAFVILIEWLEYLGVRRAPGRTEARSSGMGPWRNLRYAIRTLGRAPVFTVMCVVLVALGVGAVTTVFTLVDHVLLRPLPYPAAERLVMFERGSHSGPFFREVRGLRTVESVSGAWVSDVNLIRAGGPVRLSEARVTRDFFELFGLRAYRGRLLIEEDYESPNAVVLDAAAWRRIWGEDPGIVGQTLDIDGSPVVVVGVADPGFSVPEAVVGRSVDIWRPVDWSWESMNSEEYSVLDVAGRLAEGAGLSAVQAEVDALMDRLADTHRNYRESDDETPRLVPVVRLSDTTVRGVRAGLGLLMGAVGLLLLVACANVAHLFLARGLGRTREMAVRRAVGAGNRHLIGQLFAESLLVGLAGGLTGSLLAWGGVRTFLALNPSVLPRQEAIAIDPRVLAFAVGTSVLTSLVFGLVPALRSVRHEPVDELRGSGRAATSGRNVGLLRSALVVGEVALSLVLVTGAGLLLRSFLAVRAQDPGFEVADVWTVPLNPTEPETPAEYVQLMEGILDATRRIPGVRSAAFGLTLPMEMTGGGRCCWRSEVNVEGQGESSMMHPVSVSYFETLGIELLAGRAWAESEARSQPWPVVLSEPLARDLFGTPADAVGRQLETEASALQVIGVAADTRHYGLDRDHGPALYLPVERVPFAIPKAHLAVKVEPGAPAAIGRALREAVWTAAPRLPVPTVRRMEDWMARSTAARRFESILSSAFAGIALLLAAGGLYGTLLYMAGQRRREVGIQMALGASRARIEGQVLGSGFALGSIGVAAGLAGAWLSGRVLENRIWGVESSDPATLLGAAGLLLIVAILASWLPARRAGRVDVLETLRAD